MLLDLVALLVMLAAPSALAAGDDKARSGGLPKCHCGAYRNGAFQWMSRMCSVKEWGPDMNSCYPAHVGHPGTWQDGVWLDNFCDAGRTLCSPWTCVKTAAPRPCPTFDSQYSFSDRLQLQKAIDEYMHANPARRAAARAEYGPIASWNTRQVKSMYKLLSSNIREEFNEDIGCWDVSNVRNFEKMFRDARKFNQDIGRWDVSKATNMLAMFEEAKFFDQDIGHWDVSSVENMENMFLGASTFNQDIGCWDVSAVRNMERMFMEAVNFNQDIGKWDVSQVETMRRMFKEARSFNQDIGGWNVGSNQRMDYMFEQAHAFNQDIGKWNVSRVETMDRTFMSASAFNQDIGEWDVSSVYDMREMFKDAYTFNQDIGQWNVSSVELVNAMFSHAVAFKQDISDWNVSKVIRSDNYYNYKPFQDMFDGTIFEEGGTAAVPCIRRLIFCKWKRLNEDFGKPNGRSYRSWGNNDTFPVPDSCLGDAGVVCDFD